MKLHSNKANDDDLGILWKFLNVMLQYLTWVKKADSPYDHVNDIEMISKNSI